MILHGLSIFMKMHNDIFVATSPPPPIEPRSCLSHIFLLNVNAVPTVMLFLIISGLEVSCNITYRTFFSICYISPPLFIL